MLGVNKKRNLRHRRIRTRIKGVAASPRISVFKSNTHIYVQVVDDVAGKTLAGVSDKMIVSSRKAMTKTQSAAKVGELLAEKMKTLGISKAVFDRGGFAYHGRVKALAQALRRGGIKF